MFRLRKLRAVKKLLHSTRGNVAVLTALTLPIMSVVIGGGLEYAQALDARERLQSALDSALLATASHSMANATLTDEQLQDYLLKLLKNSSTKRFAGRLNADFSTLKFTRKDKTFSATISGSMKTTFLRLIGIQDLTIRVSAQTRSGYTRLEVALVLDVTNSMNWPGTNGEPKLSELKKAAKSFVNILTSKLEAFDDPEILKIALVPFSQYVNIGTKYANEEWLEYEPQSQEDREYLENAGIYWEGCVGSRETPWNTRDDSYMVNKIPIVMNYARDPRFPANNVWGYWADKNYCPSPILPLTSAINNKQAIIDAIDSMEADGWTYIPAGLMWGWRVLSPQAPFSEGADDITVRHQNVRKIIILMTDGENTVAPVVGYPELAWKEHWLLDSNSADKFTREACNNIKSINPFTDRPYAEIITVTFDVSSDNIKNLMEECASLGSHDAQVGELEKTFKKIADQVSDLYLSG